MYSSNIKNVKFEFKTFSQTKVISSRRGGALFLGHSILMLYIHISYYNIVTKQLLVSVWTLGNSWHTHPMVTHLEWKTDVSWSI